MKTTARIPVLLFSILAMACSKSTPPMDLAGLSEASMNFDQEGVAPFLLRLSRMVGPEFDSAAAEKVADEVGALDVDEIGYWEFSLAGNASPQGADAVKLKFVLTGRARAAHRWRS